MQLTEEQIASIFAEVKPALVESLKKEMHNSIEYNAKSTVSSIVTKEVEEWCKTNIVPAIRDQLAASKDGILAAVVPVTESIAVDLGKALAVSLADKLKDEYKRNEVFKAMFGSRY